jgi:acetylornithine deacetylase/succinyl-diaminopimelate desuccinylase-like protein
MRSISEQGTTINQRKTSKVSELATMVDSVLKKIDQNTDRAIEAAKKLCSIPTVAAKGQGIDETAELVQQMLEDAGILSELHPTSGAPVVTGHLDVGAKRTLLFYDHYDVQPAEPFDLWVSPPFEPEMRKGRFYARGIADNKGDTLSRIWAVRAYKEAGVELPVNVKFVIEGEEEISSPNLPDFTKKHADFLQADGGIWEFGSAGFDGTQEAWLGLKGILYVQLEVERLSHDAHSSNSAILPSAPFRLVWALSSLKDENEHIHIDGFYDDVVPMTEKERDFAAKINLEEESRRKFYGIDAFVKNYEGDALREAYYYQPHMSIDGLTSGYQETGSMTVLPAKASAKIDFRLVENQHPADLIKKLRSHLDARGFTDVIIAWHDGYPAAKTPVDHPFVEIVDKANQRVFDHPIRIHPTCPGSGPLYLFKDYVPMISIGIGDHDSRAHSPNESVPVDNYIKSMKRIAVIIDEMGRW